MVVVLAVVRPLFGGLDAPLPSASLACRAEHDDGRRHSTRDAHDRRHCRCSCRPSSLSSSPSRRLVMRPLASSAPSSSLAMTHVAARALILAPSVAAPSSSLLRIATVRALADDGQAAGQPASQVTTSMWALLHVVVDTPTHSGSSAVCTRRKSTSVVEGAARLIESVSAVVSFDLRDAVQSEVCRDVANKRPCFESIENCARRDGRYVSTRYAPCSSCCQSSTLVTADGRSSRRRRALGAAARFLSSSSTWLSIKDVHRHLPTCRPPPTTCSTGSSVL